MSRPALDPPRRASLARRIRELRRRALVLTVEDAVATACIARLEAERDDLRAILIRVRAWIKRPEWALQAQLAAVHGYRLEQSVGVEGEALWAEVDRLLGEED